MHTRRINEHYPAAHFPKAQSLLDEVRFRSRTGQLDESVQGEGIGSFAESALSFQHLKKPLGQHFLGRRWWQRRGRVALEIKLRLALDQPVARERRQPLLTN